MGSDWHFSHNNVIQYCNRPYTDINHMNETMVANWNAEVKPEDKIYILGDFSLSGKAVEEYVHRLNGYKILVSGNHDWTHPSHRKSKTPEKAQVTRSLYYHSGFNEIHTTLPFEYKGVQFVLSHLPYKGDSTDNRYENYRLEDEGIPMLCGHVHQYWKFKKTPKGTLMINVGVDVWNMKPTSMEEIFKLYQAEK